MKNERGSAPPSPSVNDIQFEQLYVYWREEGLAASEARLLALFQYTGGNCFRLLDLDGNVTYAPRPEA